MVIYQINDLLYHSMNKIIFGYNRLDELKESLEKMDGEYQKMKKKLERISGDSERAEDMRGC